jgi:hypothetical protein
MFDTVDATFFVIPGKALGGPSASAGCGHVIFPVPEEAPH